MFDRAKRKGTTIRRIEGEIPYYTDAPEGELWNQYVTARAIVDYHFEAPPRDQDCAVLDKCREIAQATVRGEKMPHRPSNEAERAMFREIHKLCKGMRENEAFKIIGTNLVVFSERYRVACEVDMVCRNLTTGAVYVWKWATKIDGGTHRDFGKWPILTFYDSDIGRSNLRSAILNRLFCDSGYFPHGTEIQCATKYLLDGHTERHTDHDHEAALLLLSQCTDVPF